MAVTNSVDNIRSQLASPDCVEVAAMMMPKRMTGIKHMLRPACKFFPMPISLGWQENPVDDDYPQRLLVRGLQLTDIDSGATRSVIAPWMHALYSMTYKDQPYGATEVKLEEVQFTNAFTWQHLAVLSVLSVQCTLGLSAFARHQRREGTFILLGVLLQMMEGYFAWKYPVYRNPRLVAKARQYVLHKGMTTTHFLLISHQPSHTPPGTDKPYIHLEDAAVPLPILRKGYQRIIEKGFRGLLQLANMGLTLAGVLSHANGLLVPLTLLIGTVVSEIIMTIHTPLPRYSSMEQLKTAERRPSILDTLIAICQKTGCVSVGFVETFLPDRKGKHVDFRWITKILQPMDVLASEVHPTHQTASSISSEALKRRTQKSETSLRGQNPPSPPHLPQPLDHPQPLPVHQGLEVLQDAFLENDDCSFIPLLGTTDELFMSLETDTAFMDDVKANLLHGGSFQMAQKHHAPPFQDRSSNPATTISSQDYPVSAISPTLSSSGIRRRHTFYAARNAAKESVSEEAPDQAFFWNDDESADQDWVGGIDASGERTGLHRQASLATRYHRASHGSKSTAVTSKSLAVNAGHEADEDAWIISYDTGDTPSQERLREPTSSKFRPKEDGPSSACPLSHPSTRLATFERAVNWFWNGGQGGNLFWICGLDRAGTSAIMQGLAGTAAEADRLAGAAYIRGAGDSDFQIFPTISHHLSTKNSSYQTYVKRITAQNPGLLERAPIAEQFELLIVQPFGRDEIKLGPVAWLIVIDGLPPQATDEIRLITEFISQYPTAPLLWVISSQERFEHLSDSHRIRLLNEEIPCDGSQPLRDTEVYLQNRFSNIRRMYHLDLDPPWPTCHQSLKLLAAASGSLAFVTIAARYIDDPWISDPPLQTNQLISLLDRLRNTMGSSPSSALDSLYLNVLDRVPPDIYETTRKILASLCVQESPHDVDHHTLPAICDVLKITEDDAYMGLQYLHPILRIPAPEDAASQTLEFHHADLIDFLLTPTRSRSYCVTGV